MTRKDGVRIVLASERMRVDMLLLRAREMLDQLEQELEVDHADATLEKRLENWQDLVTTLHGLLAEKLVDIDHELRELEASRVVPC